MKKITPAKNYLSYLRKTKFILVFLVLIVIGIELLILQLSWVKKNLPKKPISEYAEVVLKNCSDAPHRPTCYDREIPKLMDYITMREAFEVAKVVVEHDQEYSHCHVLGHYLSGRETKKDPSKWKDVVAQCPANVCNNGCLHGPLLTRFNSESLTDQQIEEIKPDLRDVCEPRGEWNPNPVEISMCYHGLGHLNMYITEADVRKSVELCVDEGTKPNGKSHVQTCVQGVFMQIFQPLEAEDIALVKDLIQTKDTVKEYCSQFTGESWGACHRESWPLFNEEINSPEGANEFCSYSQDATERRKCYSTVMSSVTVKILLMDKKRKEFDTYCNKLDRDQIAYCYSEAAIRLVQIDPIVNHRLAIDVCSTAPGNGENCYKELMQFSRGVFQKDENGFRKFCSSMPEHLKEPCLAFRN